MVDRVIPTIWKDLRQAIDNRCILVPLSGLFCPVQQFSECDNRYCLWYCRVLAYPLVDLRVSLDAIDYDISINQIGHWFC